MLAKLKVYRRDIQHKLDLSKSKFILGNSLKTLEGSQPNTFNCVLTSPPYANCFDYSKIYVCELWLGDFFQDDSDKKDFRLNSVRSHVHSRWPDRYVEMGSLLVNNHISPYLAQQKMWSNYIPDMIKGYFMDLGKLLSSLYPIIEKNSPLGFVVANSAYGGIPIATDLLLSDLGSKFGYTTEKIEVYRKIVPSSQQYKRMPNQEYLRESLVVLRKNGK